MKVPKKVERDRGVTGYGETSQKFSRINEKLLDRQSMCLDPTSVNEECLIALEAALRNISESRTKADYRISGVRPHLHRRSRILIIQTVAGGFGEV